MPWVAWVWIGVAVTAAVLLTFCAYEVTWKAKRLRRDLARLQVVAERAARLQSHAAALRSGSSRPE